MTQFINQVIFSILLVEAVILILQFLLVYKLLGVGSKTAEEKEGAILVHYRSYIYDSDDQIVYSGDLTVGVRYEGGFPTAQELKEHGHAAFMSTADEQGTDLTGCRVQIMVVGWSWFRNLKDLDRYAENEKTRG